MRLSGNQSKQAADTNTHIFQVRKEAEAHQRYVPIMRCCTYCGMSQECGAVHL
jgi:hypothetical protein